MEFATQILAIRKGLHLSQEKFGEMVNVSQRTVAAWESGDRMPSLTVLAELAATLDVTVDYLLGRENIQKTKQPTVVDDGLLEDTIRRVQSLPEPALARVQDFLDGLEAGLSVGSAAPAADDPAAGSAV